MTGESDLGLGLLGVRELLSEHLQALLEPVQDNRLKTTG
jgi:hypothetical protein